VLDMSAASVTQLLERYGRAVKAAEQNAAVKDVAQIDNGASAAR